MKRKKKFGFVKWILLTIILVIAVVVGSIVYQGYTLYKEAVSKSSIEEKVEDIISNPDYLTFDKIPKQYKEAVIAVEDHRFYQHGGIDIIAIGRAVINDIKAMALVEGGSTITQQLAKNMYFTQEKKFERKIAEVFVAFQLESKYSKDELLAMYINEAYFGDGYYGLLDASDGYFKKDPSKLTLFEMTLLAGLPNAPSAYSPSNNMDLAIARQNQVIDAMAKYHYLTEEEVQQLKKEQQAIQ